MAEQKGKDMGGVKDEALRQLLPATKEDKDGEEVNMNNERVKARLKQEKKENGEL